MSRSETLAEAFADICLMDAPLNARLSAYAAKLRELNFPFAEAYDNLVARLYAGEVGHDAPRVGDRIPPFNVPSQTGALVSLDDLTALGPVVVSFNRGHWCPFCEIELRTISSHHQELRKIGAQAVSIMPDRQEFTGELRASIQDAFMILTDIDNGSDGWILPVPATFVVGPDSLIRARYVDPDFRKRMEVDEIVAALRSAAF